MTGVEPEVLYTPFTCTTACPHEMLLITLQYFGGRRYRFVSLSVMGRTASGASPATTHDPSAGAEMASEGVPGGVMTDVPPAPPVPDEPVSVHPHGTATK